MKNILLWAITALLIAACGPSGPEPIQFGEAGCDHCRMTISNKSYGAEAITGKGKVFRFDAIECLLNAAKAGSLKDQQIESYYVIDASSPGTLMEAGKAIFLVSENLPSPMGEGITGFGKGEEAQKAQKQFGGSVLTWQELQGKFGK